MRAAVGKLQRIWGSQWFVLGLLGVSLSLNVYLASSRINVVLTKPKLTVGVRMPAFKAERINGENITIDWHGVDQRSTVLYVFTPTCVWCLRNIPNLQVLTSARRSDYHFIGLSLSKAGLAEYVKEHHIDFPVYTRPTVSTGGNLPFSGTPETYVVSPSGRIEKAWYGAYDDKIKAEIETTLNVHLPGLSAEKEGQLK